MGVDSQPSRGHVDPLVGGGAGGAASAVAHTDGSHGVERMQVIRMIRGGEEQRRASSLGREEGGQWWWMLCE